MLTIASFLEKCGVPADKLDYTHFQWGNQPVDKEQVVRASLSILSGGDDRRLSVDYSAIVEGQTEFIETDLAIKADGTIDVVEGEVAEREILGFADFVSSMPLIVIAEA